MPKIKLVLHHIHSRPDTYSNVQWLVRATSTLTGVTKLLYSVSDSNTRQSVKNFLEWSEFIESYQELPIREFKRWQKGAEKTYVDQEVTDAVKDLLQVK